MMPENAAPAPAARRAAGQRGQVLLLMALAMFVLIGFTGLAIDGGLILLKHRELVRLTDAAALAAAGALSGYPPVDDATRQARAVERAAEYVRLHGFDPTAPGYSLRVTFPTVNPPRKLVAVSTSRPVDLAFMRLFGFRQVTISSGSREAEAAPLDVVIVQDVSGSQLMDTYSVGDPTCLWDPNYTGPRYPLPNNWQSHCTRWPYHPNEPTTAYDYPPRLTQKPYYRTNVPWKYFNAQQDAARFFISQLDPRYDQVAIVSFSSACTNPGQCLQTYTEPARLHLALTNDLTAAENTVGFSPETIGQKGILGLVPSGGTALAAGLQMGITALTTGNARSTAVGAMIVLTDGAANVRLSEKTETACFDNDPSAPACVQARQDVMTQAQIASDKGIVIYSIFVGDPSYEQRFGLLMQWIADLTDNHRLDGNYSGSRALPTGYGPILSPAPTRNYYRAKTYAELQAAYEAILANIYTRLVN
ncbi:MAG: VWA domain-containing protein [Chloroflexi bacterium]|nr:VWA domain-containing protein [Chloroflexota bacterium]